MSLTGFSRHYQGQKGQASGIETAGKKVRAKRTRTPDRQIFDSTSLDSLLAANRI